MLECIAVLLQYSKTVTLIKIMIKCNLNFMLLDQDCILHYSNDNCGVE